MDKNKVIAEASKAYEPERKGIMSRIGSWVQENEKTLEAVQYGAVLAVVAGVIINYAGNHGMENAVQEAVKAGVSWASTLPPGVGEMVEHITREARYFTPGIDITTALAHFTALPAFAMAKVGGLATAVAGAATLPAVWLAQAAAERLSQDPATREDEEKLLGDVLKEVRSKGTEPESSLSGSDLGTSIGAIYMLGTMG